MARNHISAWISYQPASRFWLFQSVAGAGLLLAAAAVITATTWLVRRAS